MVSDNSPALVKKNFGSCEEGISALFFACLIKVLVHIMFRCVQCAGNDYSILITVFCV